MIPNTPTSIIKDHKSLPQLNSDTSPPTVHTIAVDPAQTSLMSSNKTRPRSNLNRPSSRGSIQGEELVSRESSQYWEFSCNDIIHINYEQELAKIGNSSQSFEDEYSHRCKSHGIIPCPTIRCLTSDSQRALYLHHTKIDLANWQTMLISSISSSITSIFLYGLEISKRHVNDLVAGVTKAEQLRQLCLDFITMQDDETCECLSSVLGCEVQYLSLRGNRISDSVVAAGSSRITANTTIEALDLSQNSITDEGASLLLDSLRLCPNIKYISLRSNLVTGFAFQSVFGLIIGSTLTAADSAQMKSLNTAISARNRRVKDLLKKAAKEGGVLELEEVPSLEQRVIKVGNESFIANRMIREIDLSWNEIIPERLTEAYKSAVFPSTLFSAQGAFNSTIRITGIKEDHFRTLFPSNSLPEGLRFES